MIEFEEKNNDVERIIADLKNQVLEVERDENNLEKQLKKRIQEYESLEEEIMCIRKKLDEEYIKLKFEKISNTLDEILTVKIKQRKETRYIRPAQTKMEIKKVMLVHSIDKLKGNKVRNMILSYKK